MINGSLDADRTNWRWPHEEEKVIPDNQIGY